MVVTVQCTNPQCRKYMLVELRDKQKPMVCLICKQKIKPVVPAPKTPPPVRRQVE